MLMQDFAGYSHRQAPKGVSGTEKLRQKGHPCVKYYLRRGVQPVDKAWLRKKASQNFAAAAAKKICVAKYHAFRLPRKWREKRFKSIRVSESHFSREHVSREKYRKAANVQIELSLIHIPNQFNLCDAAALFSKQIARFVLKHVDFVDMLDTPA